MFFLRFQFFHELSPTSHTRTERCNTQSSQLSRIQRLSILAVTIFKVKLSSLFLKNLIDE